MNDYYGYDTAQNKQYTQLKIAAHHQGEDGRATRYPQVESDTPLHDPTPEPDSEDYQKLGTMEQIYPRVKKLAAGNLYDLGNQWFKVYQLLDDVSQALKKRSDQLYFGGDGSKDTGKGVRGWKSPAADAFMARGPGASLKSIDDWKDAAYNNWIGMLTVADAISTAQGTIETQYQTYKTQMASAINDAKGDYTDHRSSPGYQQPNGHEVPSLFDKDGNPHKDRFKEPGYSEEVQQYMSGLRKKEYELSKPGRETEHGLAKAAGKASSDYLNLGSSTIYEGPWNAVVDSPMKAPTPVSPGGPGGPGGPGAQPNAPRPNAPKPNAPKPNAPTADKPNAPNAPTTPDGPTAPNAPNNPVAPPAPLAPTAYGEPVAPTARPNAPGRPGAPSGRSPLAGSGRTAQRPSLGAGRVLGADNVRSPGSAPHQPGSTGSPRPPMSPTKGRPLGKQPAKPQEEKPGSRGGTRTPSSPTMRGGRGTPENPGGQALRPGAGAENELTDGGTPRSTSPVLGAKPPPAARPARPSERDLGGRPGTGRAGTTPSVLNNRPQKPAQRRDQPTAPHRRQPTESVEEAFLPTAGPTAPVLGQQAPRSPVVESTSTAVPASLRGPAVRTDGGLSGARPSLEEEAALAARQHKAQEERKRIDTTYQEYLSMRGELYGEETWAVQTPGGPVVANTGERATPETAPKPTLGA